MKHMNVNPLRGQEAFGELMKTMVPGFWEKNGKHLEMMFHFYYAEGSRHEPAFFVPPDGPDPKAAVAEMVKEYCRQNKPSAVALIAEAWAYHLENVPFDLDWRRMGSDIQYYTDIRNKYGVKKEILTVQVETAIGTMQYVWEIIREGNNARLGPLTETDVSDAPHIGKFQGLLLRLPE